MPVSAIVHHLEGHVEAPPGGSGDCNRVVVTCDLGAPGRAPSVVVSCQKSAKGSESPVSIIPPLEKAPSVATIVASENNSSAGQPSESLRAAAAKETNTKEECADKDGSSQGPSTQSVNVILGGPESASSFSESSPTIRRRGGRRRSRKRKRDKQGRTSGEDSPPSLGETPDTPSPKISAKMVEAISATRDKSAFMQVSEEVCKDHLKQIGRSESNPCEGDATTPSTSPRVADILVQAAFLKEKGERGLTFSDTEGTLYGQVFMCRIEEEEDDLPPSVGFPGGKAMRDADAKYLEEVAASWQVRREAFDSAELVQINHIASGRADPMNNGASLSELMVPAGIDFRQVESCSSKQDCQERQLSDLVTVPTDYTLQQWSKITGTDSMSRPALVPATMRMCDGSWLGVHPMADTGAGITIVNDTLVNGLVGYHLKEGQARMSEATGKAQDLRLAVILDVQLAKVNVRIPAYVVSGLRHCLILGMDTLERLDFTIFCGKGKVSFRPFPTASDAYYMPIVRKRDRSVIVPSTTPWANMCSVFGETSEAKAESESETRASARRCSIVTEFAAQLQREDPENSETSSEPVRGRCLCGHEGNHDCKLQIDLKPYEFSPDDDGQRIKEPNNPLASIPKTGTRKKWFVAPDPQGEEKLRDSLLFDPKIPEGYKIADIIVNTSELAILRLQKCDDQQEFQFFVELAETALGKKITPGEYARHSRTHAKMPPIEGKTRERWKKEPSSDQEAWEREQEFAKLRKAQEDSDAQFEKWQDEGKCYLREHEEKHMLDAYSVQNSYVVYNKPTRPRVVMTSIFPNDKFKEFLKALPFMQNKIADILQQARCFENIGVLDISDAFFCIKTGENLQLMTQTRLVYKGVDTSCWFTYLPYGMSISPFVLESCVRWLIERTPGGAKPQLLHNYMDDIPSNSMERLQRFAKLLRSHGFKVLDSKIQGTWEPNQVVSILGLEIERKDGAVYLTLGEKRKLSWRTEAHSMTANIAKGDVPNQIAVLRVTGKVPKYDNVMDPRVTLFTKLIQSVAAHDAGPNNYTKPLSAPVGRLIAAALRAMLDLKEKEVPLFIDPNGHYYFFTDTSKHVIAYKMFQRRVDEKGDLLPVDISQDRLLEEDGILLASRLWELNSCYKEIMAIRMAMVSIHRRANLWGYQPFKSMMIFTDSAICVDSITKGAVQDQASVHLGSHISLLRRETAIIQLISDWVGDVKVRHVKGPDNPADELTRHPLIAKVISKIEELKQRNLKAKAERDNSAEVNFLELQKGSTLDRAVADLISHDDYIIECLTTSLADRAEAQHRSYPLQHEPLSFEVNTVELQAPALREVKKLWNPLRQFDEDAHCPILQQTGGSQPDGGTLAPILGPKLGTTLHEVSLAQQADPEIGSAWRAVDRMRREGGWTDESRTWMKENCPKVYTSHIDQLRIRWDVPMRNNRSKFHDRATWAIIAPRSLRPAILEHAHLATGHAGVPATQHLILETFWWPKLKEAVQNAVSRDCTTCRLTKAQTMKIVPSVDSSLTPEDCLPFDLLFVDGCKFATVGDPPNEPTPAIGFIDAATRFAYVGATYGERGEEAVRVFEDSFGKSAKLFHPNMTLHPDNGAAFVGGAFASYMRQRNIPLKPSVPHTPNSNGVIERYWRTLEERLKAARRDNPQWRWWQLLPVVVNNINNERRAESESPNDLLVKYIKNPEDFKAWQARRRQAGPRHRTPDFKVGDAVLEAVPARVRTKLEPLYKSQPHTVTKAADNALWIQDARGKEKMVSQRNVIAAPEEMVENIPPEPVDIARRAALLNSVHETMERQWREQVREDPRPNPPEPHNRPQSSSSDSSDDSDATPRLGAWALALKGADTQRQPPPDTAKAIASAKEQIEEVDREFERRKLVAAANWRSLRLQKVSVDSLHRWADMVRAVRSLGPSREYAWWLVETHLDECGLTGESRPPPSPSDADFVDATSLGSPQRPLPGAGGPPEEPHEKSKEKRSDGKFYSYEPVTHMYVSSLAYDAATIRALGEEMGTTTVSSRTRSKLAKAKGTINVTLKRRDLEFAQNPGNPRLYHVGDTCSYIKRGRVEAQAEPAPAREESPRKPVHGGSEPSSVAFGYLRQADREPLQPPPENHSDPSASGLSFGGKAWELGKRGVSLASQAARGLKAVSSSWRGEAGRSPRAAVETAGPRQEGEEEDGRPPNTPICQQAAVLPGPERKEHLKPLKGASGEQVETTPHARGTPSMPYPFERPKLSCARLDLEAAQPQRNDEVTSLHSLPPSESEEARRLITSAPHRPVEDGRSEVKEEPSVPEPVPNVGAEIANLEEDEANETRHGQPADGDREEERREDVPPNLDSPEGSPKPPTSRRGSSGEPAEEAGTAVGDPDHAEEGESRSEAQSRAPRTKGARRAAARRTQDEGSTNPGPTRRSARLQGNRPEFRGL